MADLIMTDSEFTAAGEELKKLGDNYESAFQSYLEILEELRTTGITAGVTSENIGSLKTSLSNLSGVLTQLAASAKTQCDDMVAEINTADTYTY